LAHTICIAISLYTMVITNYGHPERLLVLPNSLLASTFIGSLVSFAGESVLLLWFDLPPIKYYYSQSRSSSPSEFTLCQRAGGFRPFVGHCHCSGSFHRTSFYSHMVIGLPTSSWENLGRCSMQFGPQPRPMICRLLGLWYTSDIADDPAYLRSQFSSSNTESIFNSLQYCRSHRQIDSMDDW
jgi:hypothetical protein